MTMKQLSVFVENKPGTLAEITGILGANAVSYTHLDVYKRQSFDNASQVRDKYRAVGSAAGSGPAFWDSTNCCACTISETERSYSSSFCRALRQQWRKKGRATRTGSLSAKFSSDS